MNYEVVENMAGLELPVSKPAAFSFTEPATKDVERLEELLESKGLFLMEKFTRESGDKFYVNCEVVGDDYKKITVKLWRDSVRIYPKENMPNIGELAKITNAIERAFDAGLEHDLIE